MWNSRIRDLEARVALLEDIVVAQQKCLNEQLSSVQNMVKASDRMEKNIDLVLDRLKGRMGLVPQPIKVEFKH